MWVFSRGGFCSVRAGDEGRVIVRCRTRDHAMHFAEVCNAGPIQVTDDTDYRYRFGVSQEVFAAAMAAEARDIDYPNFKASIPDDDRDYAAALHGIWHLHHAMQQKERRS